MKYPVKKQFCHLPVDWIVRDSTIHPGVQLNEAAISKYSRKLEAGERILPIHVFYQSGQGGYKLVHGACRLEACLRAGLETIPALVHEGDHQQALVFAVNASAEHGERRTDEDKRRVVEIILKNGVLKSWTERKIAEICAVPRSLVTDVKSNL